MLLASLPSAPGLAFARPRSASAIVFWEDAPSALSPVTAYTVTAQPGGRTVTTGGSAHQAEIVGLTNGSTYKFTVAATNKLGVGPALTTGAITPKMTANIIGAGDFSGDKRNDLIALKSSTDRMMLMKPSLLYRGNGLGGFANTSGLHLYSNLDRIVFAPGDFDGDGLSDVMIVEDEGRQNLLLEPGNGRGGYLLGENRKTVGSKWGGMRNVLGPGDFSGDRKNDVMGIDGIGDVYLYRGNGGGGFAGARQKIGVGWSTFLTVFSPGDFSGDGKSDIMAVSKDGDLYLYRGNGIGGFAGAGQRIGSGWGGFLAVMSPGDFSGDHRSDVMAVSPAGDLVLYRGNGAGGFAAAGQKIGAGWGIYR